MRHSMYCGLMAAVVLLLGGCVAEDNPAVPANPALSPIPAAASREPQRCFDDPTIATLKQAPGLGMATDVLLLVDRTTQFPPDVRQAIEEQIVALAAPGTRLTIGSFSTYSNDTHAGIDFETFVEPDFPADGRNDAAMGALRKLDNCLAQRRVEEGAAARAAANIALQAYLPDGQRSDVAASIKQFGQRLGGDGGHRRILILASDMLENSSVTSFYLGGAMRVIDIDQELAKVEQRQLVAQLGGARVYVIGAGLIPADVESLRTHDELLALERFWTGYFERSGAQSTQIGKPLLLRPIGSE